VIHIFLNESLGLIVEMTNAIARRFRKNNISSDCARGAFLTFGIHKAGYLIR
jgi:hypothetical protein